MCHNLFHAFRRKRQIALREQLPSKASVRLTGELGKVCGIAWNVAYRPDVEEGGPRSRLIAKALRCGKLAHSTLAYITRPETEENGYSLAGVGRESIAFRDNERVVKKVFRGAGKDKVWRDAYADGFLGSYEKIRNRLGELCVPTDLSPGTLTLRPSVPLPTLQFEQPYVPDMVDVFKAPADMLSERVKHDLKYMAEVAEVLRDDEGIWLDIPGDDNLVLTPTRAAMGERAVRLVDVVPLSSAGIHLAAPDGYTRAEHFNDRLAKLKEIAAS